METETDEVELTDDEIFNGEGEPDEILPVVIAEEDQPEPEPEPAEETPSPPPGEPTIKDIMGKVSELERERDGLRGATIAERKKRQAIEGQLRTIGETLAEIKARRELPAEEEVDENGEYIPAEITFDEDDNPVGRVSLAEIKKIVEAQTKGLQDEIVSSKQQAAYQRAAAAHKQNIESIVGQDEAYPTAFNDIGQQFTELDKIYTRYVQANGIEGQTPDEAIDLIINSEIATEFNEKYPNIDPEVLVELRYAPTQAAYNRKLKKALDMAKKKTDEPEPSKVRSAIGKPGNLSGLPAQRTGGGKSLDQLADMDFDDFVNLSDAEIDRIDKIYSAKITSG